MAVKVSARGQIDPFIVMDVMREANAMAATGEDGYAARAYGDPDEVRDATEVLAERELLAQSRVAGSTGHQRGSDSTS